MPLLDAMLQSAGLTLDDIGLVAVTHGPGSFTGLRIGVSAAKGLAWAKGLPCCGVSTLAAMAYGVGDFNGLIVGAMDARRQQVYNALFKAENGRIIRLCDDRAVSCEYVAQELRDAYPSENDILIVGDGAELLYKHLQAFGIPCRMASPCTGIRAPQARRWQRKRWWHRGGSAPRRSCSRCICGSARPSGSGWPRGFR